MIIKRYQSIGHVHMGATEALVGNYPFTVKSLRKGVLRGTHQLRYDMHQNQRKFDLVVANVFQDTFSCREWASTFW